MAPSSQPNFTDRVAEAKAAEVALAGILARYTVALVRETGPDLGTGVLVSSGGTPFIATARHVAVTLPPGDVYCMPKSPGPTKVITKEDAPRLLERGEVPLSERFPLHFEERILSTDGSDVALLRLGTRPAELHEMEFYPLERARSVSLPHRYVLVCGFASDLTLVHRPTDRAAAFSRPIAGRLSAVSDPEYDPDRDLIISYEYPDGPIAAAGMSGGGVWLPPLPPQPGEGLWDLRATMLTGIQVLQFPESRAAGRPLGATRIERVAALLRR